MDGGKYLWLRNSGSTLISQLVDTILVTGAYCSLGLQLDFHMIIPIIFVSYFYKGLITISNIPLFYFFVGISKRFLNEKKLAVA